MATTSNMFLYSLTIQPPTAITQAVVGQFSGTKEQQILTVSGSRLAIIRLDPVSGRVTTLVSHDTFSIVRSAASFRLAGSTKDYILLGTDSGCIAVPEYLPAQNRLSRVHLETFGRSGVRRVVPGQYLAVDPKGRACLIASVEKSKLVYVLNRNTEAELTISSPLEAHKHGTLVFALVALDVGYANPVFAAIETSYEDFAAEALSQGQDDQEAGPVFELVYYELDLGLNHVVRKWSEPVHETASLLVPVPGGSDGPSGVLVCSEESVTYRHFNQEAHCVPIPRRRGATEDPQRKRTIVSGAMHKLKHSADAFFFLLQTEDGDLFKLTFEMEKHTDGDDLTGAVKRLKIKYFDTIPVATSICILKSGFLFAASEFGNHGFYQFERLGDNDEEPAFLSDDFSSDLSALGNQKPIYFTPRSLVNLALVESIESMNPLLDARVVNVTRDGSSPQIYAATGNGARSRLRILKHGLEVNEIVASKLPGTALSAWTTKLDQQDPYDAYIIIASASDTLVISIGEEVNQVNDSGLLTTVTTLAVQQIGQDGLVQVHPRGIRHVNTKTKQVNEWPAPVHRSILTAVTNARQVAVALSSGELVYFEVDDDGSLAEYDTRKALSATVTSLSFGPVPAGRLRSAVLAVGCDDCTVRILNMNPESTLESMSVQALTAAPSSLNIIEMEDSASGSGARLYLHIGLQSGVFLRTLLDEITGELTDTQQRFLGLKPVKIFEVTVAGKTCVLALSSKPWMGYVDPTRGFMMTPLSYEDLDWGSHFSSEQCEEGIIGVQANNLRIFTIENIRDNFVRKSLPLTYTPRQLVQHPDRPYLYVIESENNTLSPELRELLMKDSNTANGDAEVLPPEMFGHPHGKGRWASCISVIDPIGETILQSIELQGNEAAVSAAVVPFASRNGESFLVVGAGKDMIVSPRQFSEGSLHVYRFCDDGRKLELVHKTHVEEPPTALVGFQGRLAVGIGKVLRIYDVGQKQLLRKAQGEVAPQLIVSLRTQGSRIVVGDVQHAITLVVYKPETNQLVPFADDTSARWTTCTAMVDYELVAGGDKFGNLWIVRCPEKASQEADAPGDRRLLHARKYLHGSPHRLESIAHFHVQDIPTSISKASLVVGGQDVLLWSGLQGTIGVLIPFVSRDDAEFFHALETHMRSEDPSLAGRDHLAYRSYYVPVKAVIDGDVCERFRLLPNEKKQAIAGELDRSVREIERKLSDSRSSIHRSSLFPVRYMIPFDVSK
ncbi:Cleavage/polyadenylation specificity factor, A subunit [Niveomyces insectorum RCEF 264]|uniref:Cleavage/polyadenylation specificity factor, A subunit n=1 Tax=Niveomyces insectorum RCEF 264 TaxID=1081102 RepID=A0A167VMT2_9HYPO|nr:Cleavage/polyadenylation specificity factor, A subunit [Niveomyces insectorum RCEF 264]